MKKNKTLEMKIYETLGIKIFKKIAFYFHNILIFPIAVLLSKEKTNCIDNYKIGKVHSLEEIKDFKIMIWFNTLVHLCLYLLIFNPLSLIGNQSLSIGGIELFYIIINSYCIMLQRYNNIRINQFLQKLATHRENQKEKIKDEIKKEYSILKEKQDEIQKETLLNFDELIDNATMDQLKQYREFFIPLKERNQNNSRDELFDNDSEIDKNLLPLEEKNKIMKLEFKE